MKIIGRTLLILVVALLVSGITWGVGRSMTSSSGPGAAQPGVARQFDGPPGGPDGGGGFSSLMQVGQPLVELVVLIVVGQLVLAVLRRRFPIPGERRRVQRTM